MGIILVKQSQNIRSRAADFDDYDSCLTFCLENSGLTTDLSNPASEGCKKFCRQQYPSGSDGCNSDSDCKSPRTCQNNHCIGNPNTTKKKKSQFNWFFFFKNK